MSNLRPPQPPRIIDPPMEYSRGAQDAFLRQLRVFFNEIGVTFQRLLDNQGGQFIHLPYAVASDDTGQTAAVVNTAYAIDFPATAVTNGVLVQGTPVTEFMPESSGLYEFTIALQVANVDAAVQTISVWLVSDGVEVPGSNLQATIPVGGTVVRNTLLVSTDGTQVFEWFWSTPDTDVSLVATAAQTSPTRPATPAARALVRFVSAA